MASLKFSRSIFLITFLVIVLLQCHRIKGHGGTDDHDEDTSATSDGGGGGSLHSKGLILVKVWCLLIFFVSTFAGGISPYFYRWNESFLLLGTQFAGGVFLGTSLMHFLSDSTETFGGLTSKSYPFSFMLASAGYLLTMMGDCVIVYVTSGVEREARVEVDSGRVVEECGKEVAAAMDPVFLRTSSLSDTILLIMALCFHSVFEGIAVGVAGN